MKKVDELKLSLNTSDEKEWYKPLFDLQAKLNELIEGHNKMVDLITKTIQANQASHEQQIGKLKARVDQQDNVNRAFNLTFDDFESRIAELEIKLGWKKMTESVAEAIEQVEPNLADVLELEIKQKYGKGQKELNKELNEKIDQVNHELYPETYPKPSQQEECKKCGSNTVVSSIGICQACLSKPTQTECEHEFKHDMHYAKCTKCGVQRGTLMVEDFQKSNPFKGDKWPDTPSQSEDIKGHLIPNPNYDPSNFIEKAEAAMTDLDKQIEEILGDGADYWCGCYEGDLGGNFTAQKNEAKLAIKSLIKAELESLRVEKEDDRPEISEWLIGKDHTIGYNQCAEEVNRKIDEKVASL